jgi:hypothetical protein
MSDEHQNDHTTQHLPVTPPAGDGGDGGGVAGAFGYALVFDRGPVTGYTYVLGPGTTEAGRSNEADLFLGDVTVSRRHAEFSVDGGSLTVRDLGSTNGIYVNMVPVDEATLSPGDEVIIGKFHLIVVRGDA